jgi:hypothetical protein
VCVGKEILLRRTLSVCVVLVTTNYMLHLWTSFGRILPNLLPAPSDTLSRYNIDTISPVFLSLHTMHDVLTLSSSRLARDRIFNFEIMAGP